MGLGVDVRWKSARERLKGANDDKVHGEEFVNGDEGVFGFVGL